MKRMIFAAMLLLISVSMNSMSTITMGDSIRVKPAKLDGYHKCTAVMYNEGYCDSWNMSVVYPEGLTVKLVSGITALDGMTIPYVNRYGEEMIYNAPLNVSAAYATISSEITVNGYWDYNGNGEYDPYGTVKWVPGAHSLFELNFYIDNEFRAGYVTFDGRITSGGDQRGPILQDVRFYSSTYVWVGYLKGDLTGNEKLDVSDIVELIDRVLGKTQLDEFSEAAADVNGDGIVDIDDVTILTELVLG